MPIFLSSGALQSRMAYSGDLVSGDIYVGNLSSGALTSGTVADLSMLSGHIASGIGGGQTVEYYKQVGVLRPCIYSVDTPTAANSTGVRGYPAGLNLQTFSTTNFTAAENLRVYCMPFATNRDLTTSRVAVLLTQKTTTSAALQMGLYDSDSKSLWPTTLLQTTGDLLISGDINTRIEYGATWNLSANKLYWAAFVQGGAVRNFRGCASPFYLWGLSSTLNNGTNAPEIDCISYRASGGTYPLPDPFPTTSGTLEGIATAFTIPVINFFF